MPQRTVRAPINRLPIGERQRLLDDLNYLNISEVKAFCKRHTIPYAIFIKTTQGMRRAGEDDRKGIVLTRVRHFLQTGTVLPPTCFPESILAAGPLPANPRPADRLHYGQYDKRNGAMLAVLASLTDGQFRHGAVARILARDFWSRGCAPTLEEFASAWLHATRTSPRPRPEWAFLSDRASGTAGKNWKAARARVARRILPVLYRITTNAVDASTKTNECPSPRRTS